MPYKLYYLPCAQQDILDVVRYVGVTLQNPDAARRMVRRFTAAAESVCSMPYARPVYIPVRPLKYEYRKLIVGSYLLFYRVDERLAPSSSAGSSMEGAAWSACWTDLPCAARNCAGTPVEVCYNR